METVSREFPGGDFDRSLSEPPNEQDVRVREEFMDEDEFDAFIDGATHAVADLFTRRFGGKILSIEDLYALNDALTSFFNGKV